VSSEEDRQAWLAGVKDRLGLVTIGGDKEGPQQPVWPVLEEGATYQLVSEHAMASFDGVNFYVKPDGMSMAEFLASLH
jgi:hypothetical protein